MCEVQTVETAAKITKISEMGGWGAHFNLKNGTQAIHLEKFT